MSFVATDGKDRNGSKFKKIGPVVFSDFDGMSLKITTGLICLALSDKIQLISSS